MQLFRLRLWFENLKSGKFVAKLLYRQEKLEQKDNFKTTRSTKKENLKVCFLVHTKIHTKKITEKQEAMKPLKMSNRKEGKKEHIFSLYLRLISKFLLEVPNLCNLFQTKVIEQVLAHLPLEDLKTSMEVCVLGILVKVRNIVGKTKSFSRCL